MIPHHACGHTNTSNVTMHDSSSCGLPKIWNSTSPCRQTYRQTYRQPCGYTLTSYLKCWHNQQIFPKLTVIFLTHFIKLWVDVSPDAPCLLHLLTTPTGHPYNRVRIRPIQLSSFVDVYTDTKLSLPVREKIQNVLVVVVLLFSW